MSVKHRIKIGSMVKTADGYVPETREVETTPIKAIRLMCIECMGHQMQYVEGCSAPTCPLYPYRMGDAHVYSDETKRRMAERAKKSTFGRPTTISTLPYVYFASHATTTHRREQCTITKGNKVE